MSLIGDNPPPPPVPDQPAWEPIRQALARPASSDTAEPVTEEGMNAALTAAVKLYTTASTRPSHLYSQGSCETPRTPRPCCGSILDAASAIITTCWLLLLERQFDQVRTLALQWADRIEPKLSTATTADLSTWGWLPLRASAAAARDNRPGEAAQTIRLAEAAAITVGSHRGSYHSY